MTTQTLKAERKQQFSKFNLRIAQLVEPANIATILHQLEQGQTTEAIRFLRQLNDQADKISAAVAMVEAGIKVGHPGASVKDIEKAAKIIGAGNAPVWAISVMSEVTA